MAGKRRRAPRSVIGMYGLAAVLLAPFVFALPPDPQLGDWNEDNGKLIAGTQQAVYDWLAQRIKRRTWNCYNYGVDRQTTDANGDPVRAHPGKGQAWPNPGQAITAQQMCDKCKARAKADGLNNVPWNSGDPIPTLPAGQNLVALGALAGVKGDTADYHWWRLNGDGSWSHKRGSTKAKTTYTDANGIEQPLTDPREAAQRDGYDLCGFMSVKKDTPPDVGPLALAGTDCGPGLGKVVLSEIIPSGFSDPEMLLQPQQVQQLMPFLPTFTVSNEIPEPAWGGVPAGQPAGFEIFFDPLHLNPAVPVYLRVFQQAVEVVQFRFDLNIWGLFYYNDDRGLEKHLQVVFQPPVGACCGPDLSCGQTTACACAELDGFYAGDGIECEAALCPTDCAWDCDGSNDGNVNVSDLLALLGQYDASAPVNCFGGSCDFNEDGCVGVVDLLKMLAHYTTDPTGAGCP